MNKNLLKFYIFFLITFIVFINIFPNIFLNINNSIDYLKFKTITAFKNNQTIETNIYNDKANIIIMFDDGWKTQYTVGYNYMHKKNMRGSIAVITNSVGSKYYLNKSHLGILFNANWDLLNHTYSHTNLKESDLNTQIDEIKNGGNWLKSNNLNIQNNILIYPEGEYNSDTVTAMKNLNYISGRTVKEGYNAKNPIDLYDIKVKNVLTLTKSSWVNEWVDYAIENNLTLILLFHKIENKTDDSQMIYKENDFYKIIDYIDKKRDNLNIITYSEWMQTINLHQN